MVPAMTNEDRSELIATLRSYMGAAPTCRDAANELERLGTENQRLCERLKEVISAISASRALWSLTDPCGRTSALAKKFPAGVRTPSQQYEALAWFTSQMRFKLEKHMHTRPGWGADDSHDVLMERLEAELRELKGAFASRQATHAMLEAADVANMAMIAAQCFALSRGIDEAALSGGDD